MCDCFHLAFPNWHGPAAGTSRRLRGPEQEDDSVCEEPEILEGERPRPQGSSPTEEFPDEKQGGEDIYEPSHKMSKKSRRVGFGSLFDKRPSAKMSDTEEIESGEPGVIVKTVKEVSADGLVVTGGGKEGIFIKEVKPDSPASKHLSVKEGDQILSATVYFDNVSYEDALQILERAQPYKMEFCLKRKVESVMPEDAQMMCPEDTDSGLPEIRGQRKKQQDRISWPKFPSFGKGRRKQFKRSHSTSEAEDCRKLEMSPPASDTESPLKSPLISPDGKDKKRKHKIQLKMKMKEQRSKSVEEAHRNENEFLTDEFVVLENQEVEDIIEENFPEEPVSELVKTTYNKDRFEIPPKDSSAIPILTETALKHKTHLISLDSTLKTTDISVALLEGSASDIISVDRKTERSEIKINIHQKEKSDAAADSQSINISGVNIISTESPLDNISIIPAVKSQVEVERADILENDLGSGNIEQSMSNVDASQGLSDVVILEKSPKPSGEKQWKEKNIFEIESYGIRTRGPLADIATKTHFDSTVNELQFVLPDSSDVSLESNLPEPIPDPKQQSVPMPVTFQPKLNSNIVTSGDVLAVTTSEMPPDTDIDNLLTTVDKKSKAKFKLPKVDLSGFAITEPIKITKVEWKTHLPKREDIEIPGMEDKKSKISVHTKKTAKTEKIINVSNNRGIQSQQTDFNVEDVKEAVSKFPSLKLPEGDITGVLVQREITLMEMKGDRINITPRGSPYKLLDASSDSTTKVPKVQIPYIDEETAITKVDFSKLKDEEDEAEQTKTGKILVTDDTRTEDIKFKLPKREDIEIPGMESIKKSNVQYIVVDEQPYVQERKGKEKKSKKSKITKPSYGITKPEIRLPDIGTELPEKDISSERAIKEKKIEADVFVDKKDSRICVDKMQPLEIETVSAEEVIKQYQSNTDAALDKKEPTKFKTPKIGDPFNIDDPVYEIRIHQDKIKPKNDILEAVHAIDKSKINFADTEIKMSVGPAGIAQLPKAESAEIDSERPGMKAKSPVFSIPKFGFPKLDIKVPQGKESSTNALSGEHDEAHPTLTEIKVSDVDKDRQYSKTCDFDNEGQGSKFKLPKFEISFPEMKVPKIISSTSKKEVTVPEREVLTLAQLEVDTTTEKPVYTDTERKSVSVDVKKQILEVEGQGTTIQKPTFEISHQEIKGPKISLMTEGNQPEIEVSAATGKEKAGLPEVHLTSTGHELRVKRPGFSFSKFGFSKSDSKATESDVILPNADVPERTLEKPQADIAISVCDDGQKDSTKLVSPTKFKLPSITLPKLGSKSTKGTLDISSVDAKGPKDLKDADLNLSVKTPSADINADRETKEKKTQGQDIESDGQGNKFKLPKFGISLSPTVHAKADIKASKVEVEIPLSEERTAQPPELEVPTEDLSEIDYEVKMKSPGISLPKHSLSEVESNIHETDVNTGIADAALLDGNAHLERPSIKLLASVVVTEQKDETKFGPPTKFKLPSVSPPKHQTKSEKETLDSSKPDIKGSGSAKAEPTVNIDTTAQDKLKLPKFGISLPEVKGPKIDLSTDSRDFGITPQKGQVEVLPSDFKSPTSIAGVKEDLEEIDSKDGDIKIKSAGFSYPKFGYSKSEAKLQEATVRLPDVDISSKDVRVEMPKISLSEAELKLLDKTEPNELKKLDAKEDISFKIDMKAQDIKSESGVSKFKFPKFGISLPDVKGPKIDLQRDKKGHDITLPEGETEVQSPDLGELDVHAEVKENQRETDSQGLDMKVKWPGFSFPKFGFSKSDAKGSDVDMSLPDVDVSLTQGHTETETPNKDISVGERGKKESTKFGSPTKFKLPSISLPKFGAKSTKGKVDISATDIDTKGPDISLPDTELKMKAPEVYVGLPNVDRPLPDSSEDVQSKLDVTVPEGDTVDIDASKQGSSTTFKLPSINLSKLGISSEKQASESSSVDVLVKAPEISLPDAELKLSRKTESAAVKKLDDKEDRSLNVDVKAQDIQSESGVSKLKFPKFGISLPEVKGPKIELHGDKKQHDITLPEGEAEVHPPDLGELDVHAEGKKDQREQESQGFDANIKRPDFSFPKFGFSKSDAKGSDIDMSLPDVDVSLTQGHIEIEQQNKDISVGEGGKKESTKFGSPTKFKLPSISLPKFGAKSTKGKVDISATDTDTKGPDISLPDTELKIKAPEVGVGLPNVDIPLPDANVEVESKADITVPEGDAVERVADKHGSSTKYKLPLVSLSKRGTEVDKEATESSAVDVQVKMPEVSLPDAELKLSKTEPVDIKKLDGKADISLNVDVKTQNIQTQSGESKFKFPKFDISLPEVKGPKIDLHRDKKERNIILPEGEAEVHPPDLGQLDVHAEVKEDKKELDSQDIDVKIKRPGFSFPKFGFSKSEDKGSEADIGHPDIEESLAQVNKDITVGEAGKKEPTKFGSPTKFKLPSISLPKFGAKSTKGKVVLSATDIDTKGPGISLPDTELKMKAPEADVGLPNVDIPLPDSSADVQSKLDVTVPEGDAVDIDASKQGSLTKFKLPSVNLSKLEISSEKQASESSSVDVLVKAPEISLPDAELKLLHKTEPAEVKKLDDKEDRSLNVDVKAQGIQSESGVSKLKFPKFGISLPEVKGPKIELHGDKKQHDITLPEGEAEVHPPDLGELDIHAEGKKDQREQESQGFDANIKRPDFSFPKFGFSKSDAKGSDIDMSLPDVDVSLTQGHIEIEQQNKDISVGEGGKKESTKFGSPTKFKLPSISLPKFGAKSTKGKVDISATDTDTKGPDISLPDTELKIKAPEVGVGLPNVDIPLPDANVEVESKADITVPEGDAVERVAAKHGSSTKYKLPLVSLSKRGTEVDKEAIESSAVDVQVKMPEVSLPDAELKLSKTEPVDIKKLDGKADISLNIDVKTQNIQTQSGESKFKFPKFDISLPEVKGPKIDLHRDKKEGNIILPEGEAEVHPPDLGQLDVHAEVKEDKKELDSQDIDVKIKRPGFSFPKFGFSKSEDKGPEADIGHPDIEESLAQGNVEAEEPNKDITVVEAEKKESTKFGSPTKFKLPPITLPKFAAKSKMETVIISTIETDAKVTETGLLDEDTQFSAETILVDLKEPKGVKEDKSLSMDLNVQDIQSEGQVRRFKFPKFEINFPERKGPRADMTSVKMNSDVSVPERKLEVHTTDAELPDATTEIKTDSKSHEAKSKRPSFSFPKFGFSKSETKVPEIDMSLSNVDMSKVEMEGPNVAVAISEVENVQDKDKFGSPTKFKLPSIGFPVIGTKSAKGADVSSADIEVEGPDMSLPDAEIKILVKPLKEDDVDGLSSADRNAKDMHTESELSKFKSPKFEIALSKVKGPKINLGAIVTEPNIFLPDGKVDANLSNAEMPKINTKGADADKDETALNVEVKSHDIQMKGLVNLPEFGLNLPEETGKKICDKKIEITIPKEKQEVQPLDLGDPLVTTGMKEYQQETYNMKKTDVPFSTIGYSKSETKAVEANMSLTNVDMSLSEGSVVGSATAPLGSGAEQKKRTKFGSPTKFKLPSINFPKFGATSKGISQVDTDTQRLEIILPDTELQVTADPLSTEIKDTEVVKSKEASNVDMQTSSIQTEVKESKFKWPKFGISLPEMKGTKMDVSTTKPDPESSLPEGKIEAHLSDAEASDAIPDVKVEFPEVVSKGPEVKSKQSSFSFPKFGFSKSEIKTIETETIYSNVDDVSLQGRSINLDQTQADITASEGDTVKGDETKFGSPTKFKLPSISLPKFVSKAEKEPTESYVMDAQAKVSKISLPHPESKLSVDLKKPHIDKHQTSLNVGIETESEKTKFKVAKVGATLPEVKGQKMDVSTTKTDFDISLPEGKVEVPAAAAEKKEESTEIDDGLEWKIKRPGITFPKLGFSKLENKSPDINVPIVDVFIPQGEKEESGADIAETVGDARQKEPTRFSSPTRFKLPSITLPKFGAKSTKETEDTGVNVDVKEAEKTLPDVELKLSAEPLTADIKGSDLEKGGSVHIKAQDAQGEGQMKFKFPKFGMSLPESQNTLEGKVTVPEPDSTNANTEISATNDHIQLRYSMAQTEIKDTFSHPSEGATKKEEVKEVEKGSPIRFKLPTIKKTKISISKTKSQEGDDESATAQEVILEPKHKEDSQKVEKSKFTMPTLGDVLRGFDIEFNVPTLDETEEAGKEKLFFENERYEAEVKEEASTEKLAQTQTEQKSEDEKTQAKPEKSGWFKFPKFSSPTKTAKSDEKETSESPKKPEENPVMGMKERESEKSSTKETEEDNVSPTLSLRSSDAFADVSSIQTTEQLGLTLGSPTKVKVKYFEPTPTVEVSDLHGDLITSTARTQLISMEPHRPEKVNIPFSSETSSSSVDTSKQMSGQIHVFVSNIQTLPDTQHAAVLTNIDVQSSQTLPPKTSAMKSDVVLSAEEIQVQKGEHFLVEKHVVKEMIGYDNKSVLVTQKIQVFEGGSDDTASSIQKLKHTVHTEKMRFFEDAEPNTSTIITETSLRHADSSTDENEGK